MGTDFYQLDSDDTQSMDVNNYVPTVGTHGNASEKKRHIDPSILKKIIQDPE